MQSYLSEERSFCFCCFPNSSEIQAFISSDESAESQPAFVMNAFTHSQGQIKISNYLQKVIKKEILHNISFNPNPAPLNSKPISKNEYKDFVNKAKTEFDSTDFTKVIAARNHLIAKPKDFNAFNLFALLVDSQIESFRYLFYSPSTGLWLGASPELLMKYNGKDLLTMSLAGTKKKGDASWSEKETDEQNIVTRFIETSLGNLGFEEVKTEPTKLKESANLQHLCNDIFATSNKSINSFKIAKTLHPTPAISGYNRERAIDFISENEQMDRSYYSGYLGLIDDKNADLYVNLRCLRVGPDQIELFAGAGITKDSDAEEEYNETEKKLESLLQYLV